MPYERVWSFRASKTRRGVDLLLERYHDAEIVSYDPGDGEAIIGYSPEDNTPVEIAPAVTGSWATIKLRWFASICSGHYIGDPDCPRCQAGGDVLDTFAIWKETGNVYKVDEHGAAADDPWLTVTPLTDDKVTS